MSCFSFHPCRMYFHFLNAEMLSNHNIKLYLYLHHQLGLKNTVFLDTNKKNKDEGYSEMKQKESILFKILLYVLLLVSKLCWYRKTKDMFRNLMILPGTWIHHSSSDVKSVVQLALFFCMFDQTVFYFLRNTGGGHIREKLIMKTSTTFTVNKINNVLK